MENLTLIDGHFSPEDANEILKSVFSSKIHFHEMKNFSSKERFGIDNKIAKEKIPILKNSLEKLSKIIEKAKAEDKQIIIKSEIVISYADSQE